MAKWCLIILILATFNCPAVYSRGLAGCRKFVKAPLLVTRATPVTWSVTTEREELLQGGATQQVSRHTYDMSMASTLLSCDAKGATMLLSINSILCGSVGDENFCSMGKQGLSAVSRLGLVYKVAPDGSVPLESRALALLAAPTGLSAAQPSVAQGTSDARALPAGCPIGSKCIDRIYTLLASLAGQLELSNMQGQSRATPVDAMPTILHPNLQPGDSARAGAASGLNPGTASPPDNELIISASPAKPAATSSSGPFPNTVPSGSAATIVLEASGYIAPTEASIRKQGGSAATLGGGGRIRALVNPSTGALESLAAAWLINAPFSLPEKKDSYNLNSRWHLTIGAKRSTSAAGPAAAASLEPASLASPSVDGFYPTGSMGEFFYALNTAAAAAAKSNQTAGNANPDAKSHDSSILDRWPSFAHQVATVGSLSGASKLEAPGRRLTSAINFVKSFPKLSPAQIKANKACSSCAFRKDFVNFNREVSDRIAGTFGIRINWFAEGAVSLYNRQRADLYVGTEVSVTATLFSQKVNVAQGQLGVTAGAGKQGNDIGAYIDARANAKVFGRTVFDRTKSWARAVRMNQLAGGCKAIENAYNPVYDQPLGRIGPADLPWKAKVTFWGVLDLYFTAGYELKLFQGSAFCTPSASDRRLLLINGFVARASVYAAGGVRVLKGVGGARVEATLVQFNSVHAQAWPIETLLPPVPQILPTCVYGGTQLSGFGLTFRAYYNFLVVKNSWEWKSPLVELLRLQGWLCDRNYALGSQSVSSLDDPPAQAALKALTAGGPASSSLAAAVMAADGHARTASSPQQGCFSSITASSGWFASAEPNQTLAPGEHPTDPSTWLTPYLNKANCSWVVPVAPGHTINLTFVHLETEKYVDKVYIKRGSGINPADKEITYSGWTGDGKMPSLQIPIETEAQGGVVVRFTSDDVLALSGFLLTYSVTPTVASTNTRESPAGHHRRLLQGGTPDTDPNDPDAQRVARPADVDKFFDSVRREPDLGIDLGADEDMTLPDFVEGKPDLTQAFRQQQLDGAAATRSEEAWDAVFNAMPDEIEGSWFTPSDLPQDASRSQVEAYYNNTLLNVNASIRSDGILNALVGKLPDTDAEFEAAEDAMDLTYVCCTSPIASSCSRTTDFAVVKTLGPFDITKGSGCMIAGEDADNFLQVTCQSQLSTCNGTAGWVFDPTQNERLAPSLQTCCKQATCNDTEPLSPGNKPFDCGAGLATWRLKRSAAMVSPPTTDACCERSCRPRLYRPISTSGVTGSCTQCGLDPLPYNKDCAEVCLVQIERKASVEANQAYLNFAEVKLYGSPTGTEIEIENKDLSFTLRNSLKRLSATTCFDDNDSTFCSAPGPSPVLTVAYGCHQQLSRMTIKNKAGSDGERATQFLVKFLDAATGNPTHNEFPLDEVNDLYNIVPVRA